MSVQSYVTPEYYQYILSEFEKRGIAGVSPILHITPYGHLISYVKEHVFPYSWEQNGVTHYGNIPLGMIHVPVFYHDGPIPLAYPSSSSSS